jgi:hypothetical protein
MDSSRMFFGLLDKRKSVCIGHSSGSPGSESVEEHIPFKGHGKLLGVQIEDGAGRVLSTTSNQCFGNRPFLVVGEERILHLSGTWISTLFLQISHRQNCAMGFLVPTQLPITTTRPHNNFIV